MNTRDKFDIVYYYKKTSEREDEIRYSIRSVEKNLPFNRIVVVGDKPTFYKETNRSIYIRSNLIKPGNWTIGWVPFQHMKNYLKWEKEEKDFLLFNDDFFIVDKIDKWIDYRRSERSYNKNAVKVHSYHMRTLRSLAITNGKHYFNLHCPMRLNTKNLRKMIDFWEKNNEKNLDFRTLYGNLFEYKNLVELDDVKFNGNVLPKKGQKFISTTSWSFKPNNPFYEYMKKEFPEKSFCEV